jgi:hypothetical protein
VFAALDTGRKVVSRSTSCQPPTVNPEESLIAYFITMTKLTLTSALSANNSGSCDLRGAGRGSVGIVTFRGGSITLGTPIIQTFGLPAAHG